MTRELARCSLAGLGATLVLATGCGPSGPKTTVVPDGTSVVFLTIDTLRQDHLGRSGHRRNTTPYLDRLAAESVYFTHAFAQSSWTLPSMLSMFSSLEPAIFGVTRGVAPLDKPDKAGKLGVEEVVLEYFSNEYTTLTEVLNEAGFVTAGFSTNGHLRVEQGFAQGFAVFDQVTCTWEKAECVFEIASDWLDEYVAVPRDRPFFLWIHLFDPHFDERHDGDLPSPLYTPARGDEELFARPDETSLPLEERTRIAYDRKIRHTDDQIALFVEDLRERGLLDGSLFVVAADHGEEFNEKGRWGHSKSLENTLVRVPLLFRTPGGTAQAVVDAPVSNMDIAPTVLEFLGFDVPDAMRGTSLLSALRGEPLEPKVGYGETRRFEFDYRFRIDPARNRKLVLDMHSGTRSLYSITDDPSENTDLAAIESHTADAMERELRDEIVEMESRSASHTRRDSLSAEEIQHLRDLGYL